ncbi:hypothetical protein D6C77_09443 [Aureobasidium pullulans]|nr:hypothetical protein D6C77_09443 [Aureobasidium pullulans]
MALPSTSLHKELASRGLVLLRGGQAQRRSGRLNVRARSGRTTRSTGYAESQSESPNRFGSDAARDDSTVFDHDDSGSPVRNQRQENHNQSISPPLSEAGLSCGERPSDEALPAHGESSGRIRRLSRSFSNFSLTDNRVVRSKTTGNLRPPFSLMRHHIRTGSQASQEELLPRGRVPGRSGGSLQVATQSLGGQEPSFWDDALSNRNAANLGGSQPPAGTSGPQSSSLPPFDSFFNAVLPFQPQRSSWLGLSTLFDSSQTATTTGQSTLEPRPQPFLNPSIRPPPPAYSREPLPGAKYFAESQRQYDLVADLHRELDDEARHDGDQAPPVVPESADTNPDYTFQSQNLAEEVIWRY